MEERIGEKGIVIREIQNERGKGTGKLLPQLSQTQLWWYLVSGTGYCFRGIFFIIYVSIREVI
jgi:hypothetical protein